MPAPLLPHPATWPAPLRWVVLILGSSVLALVLGRAHLSAALLLGPMIVAIAMAGSGAGVAIPRIVFIVAQSVVGMMMASKLPPELFPEIARDWPIFAMGILSTVLGASSLGWLLSRSGMLPGTTAIWGSSPGAATVMTLMSDSYGADMRLVAMMQYLRVACCAIAATAVVKIFGITPSQTVIAAPPETTLNTLDIAKTLALAIGAGLLGWRLKVPGGGLLTPLIAGMIYNLSGLGDIALPQPVLALSYAIVGWGIGMRFSREVLRHAARVLPLVLGMIVTLIALCAGFAALLVRFAGIEPVTAYLATSPGGADSVAIIAAGTQVDIPFVMAMQIGRFLLVLIAGPALARYLSRK
ncbi:AbrB family transcriptional regulator [Thioclava sp.]|uniref:AbrB family transcriptional regulator n=1 Tax=Thioclava sp. TaxID=1933450 RepID=UPI003AA80FC3